MISPPCFIYSENFNLFILTGYMILRMGKSVFLGWGVGAVCEPPLLSDPRFFSPG
jgi:hypothetical protein